MNIEFLKIVQAVAMGFAALGALGYFVKVKKYFFNTSNDRVLIDFLAYSYSY